MQMPRVDLVGMPTIGERLRVVRLATFAGLLLLRPVGHLVEALHHLRMLFFGREVALEGDEDHLENAAAAAFGATVGRGAASVAWGLPLRPSGRPRTSPGGGPAV